MKRDEITERKFVDDIWKKATNLASGTNLVCAWVSCATCPWNNFIYCRSSMAITYGFLKGIQSQCTDQDDFLLIDGLIKQHFFAVKKSSDNDDESTDN